MDERRALDDLKIGEQVRMWSPEAGKWLYGVVELGVGKGVVLKSRESGIEVGVCEGLFVPWKNRPGYATSLPNRFVVRGWAGWLGDASIADQSDGLGRFDA